MVSTNPNTQFDTENLPLKDPGRLDQHSLIRLVDMLNAFAHRDGLLKVFDPNDPTKLHPDVPEAIRQAEKLLDIAFGKQYTGVYRPVASATLELHQNGNPSWNTSYPEPEKALYQILTPEKVESFGWSVSDWTNPSYTFDDFMRHLDIVHRVRVYTRHAPFGTRDAQLIDAIRNSPYSDMIERRYKAGFQSNTSGIVPHEQMAVSEYMDTNQSTGVTESDIARGIDHELIVGFCLNICCARQAVAAKRHGMKRVTVLIDASVPLEVSLAPEEATNRQLRDLGLDPNYPITLTQYANALMLYWGVELSTVDMLAHNMGYRG